MPKNATTKTETETQSNGYELAAIDDKPVIHPMARPAAKHRNMAVALLQECPETRSVENLLALAQVEALISIAESLGTAHYDAKGVLGLLPKSGNGKTKAVTAADVKEIDFS